MLCSVNSVGLITYLNEILKRFDIMWKPFHRIVPYVTLLLPPISSTTAMLQHTIPLHSCQIPLFLHLHVVRNYLGHLGAGK